MPIAVKRLGKRFPSAFARPPHTTRGTFPGSVQMKGRTIGLTRNTPFRSQFPNARDKHEEPVAGGKNNEEDIYAPPKELDTGSSSDGSNPAKRRKLEPASQPLATVSTTFRLPGRRSRSEERSLSPALLGVEGRRNRTTYVGKAQGFGKKTGKQGQTAKYGRSAMGTTPFVTPSITARKNTSSSREAAKISGSLQRLKHVKDRAVRSKQEEAPTFKTFAGQSALFKGGEGANANQNQQRRTQGKSRLNATAQSGPLRRSTRNGFSPKVAVQNIRAAKYIEKLVRDHGLEDQIQGLRSRSRESSISPLEHETVGSESPLSIASSVSAPSSLEDVPGSSSTSISTIATASTTRCSMCGRLVPTSLLSNFRSQLQDSHQPLLSVRQQSAFCRFHKAAEAEATWQERHYPAIDWTTLPRRLDSYTSHITAVLDQDTRSFYRDRLRALLTGTTNRTRTAAHEYATGQDGTDDVGYYGSKGQRAFADWIMQSFSLRLGQLQKVDPDLALAGGVGHFVQKVLIPEVAHKLIMEDLERDPQLGVGVRERAMQELRRKEAEARKSAIRRGEDEDKAVEALGIDWSVVNARGKEGEELLGRWTAKESAEIGTLLSEEDEDMVVSLEEEEEEAGEAEDI